jgi:hypothetical protein
LDTSPKDGTGGSRVELCLQRRASGDAGRIGLGWSATSLGIVFSLLELTLKTASFTVAFPRGDNGDITGS